MKNPLKRSTLNEAVIYTPFDLSDAQSAGRRRFWKQVLPNTSINYKGREIKFDKKFHMDLAQSFKDEAFDQVPVVFADADNRHNMDPRNFGGDVLDMQVRPNGLYALIEADEDAAKAIQKNPRLGVSARIRQALEKADGRKFDRAIEHICLTMNPRVTGMEPWQAVDLSDEDADIEVVDLTAESYEEENTMGVRTATKKASSKQPQDRRRKGESKIDLSALTDEQFESLLDLAETLTRDPGVEEDEDEDFEEEDEEDEKPTARTRRKKSKTKVTIEKDSEEDGDEEEDEDEDDETDLSDSVIRRDEVSQFQQMRLDLAEERWGRERDEYISAGVPAFMLDLAEPVLALPDSLTIDLSDDESIDATDIIRKILDGAKGVVDLTGEMGHQIDLSDDEDDEATALLNEWDKQYG